MVPVDSAEPRQRINSAEMQHQHGLGHGILLVIAECSLDQQAITDETIRRVTLFAGGADAAVELVQALGEGWDTTQLPAANKVSTNAAVKQVVGTT
jgi:hypothetical protein